jgi:hypothetical protein
VIRRVVTISTVVAALVLVLCRRPLRSNDKVLGEFRLGPQRMALQWRRLAASAIGRTEWGGVSGFGLGWALNRRTLVGASN